MIQNIISFRYGILPLLTLAVAVLPYVSYSPASSALLVSRTPQAVSSPLSLDGTAQVTITNDGFSPAQLMIRSGTTVTWYNASGRIQRLQSGIFYKVFVPLLVKSGTSQRVDSSGGTSAEPVVPLQTTEVFTATLPPGGSFSYTFITVGDYPYFLETQPTVQGRVEAQELVVGITQPLAGAIIRDDLQIDAIVGSQFDIREVKARVEEHEVMLAAYGRDYCDRYGCDTEWRGSVPLAGLARGEHTIVVTATNTLSMSVTAQQSFTRDLSPTLVISAPFPAAVARPNLLINAACYDDDPAGCTSIEAYLACETNILTDTLVSGQSAISQTVSPAAYGGQVLTLKVQVRDSSGAIVTEDRPIYVDSSNKITLVEQVPGQIWEVHPDRILFLEQTSRNTVLKIRERASGQDTVVMSGTTILPLEGFLTPEGAIFVESGMVYEWRDGLLLNFGQANSSTASLKVSGNYAIWSQGDTLIRRDLVAGTNEVIATDAVNLYNDVAANGDVVYAGHFEIYRVHNGSKTQLTFDNPALWNSYVTTDGINVAYRRHSPCCPLANYQIMLYGAAGEEILADARSQGMIPGRDYQLNGEWAAYTDLGRQGQLHVWVRSPGGVKNAITYFATSSIIDALAPNGEVMFFNGNRRYLGQIDLDSIEISSSLGKSFWQDGAWFVQIGGALFQLAP